MLTAFSNEAEHAAKYNRTDLFKTYLEQFKVFFRIGRFVFIIPWNSMKKILALSLPFPQFVKSQQN